MGLSDRHRQDAVARQFTTQFSDPAAIADPKAIEKNSLGPRMGISRTFDAHDFGHLFQAHRANGQ
jgi:hypothetical protein